MLSQQVKELEQKHQQALDLAGEILATLKVNRGLFCFAGEDVRKEWERIVGKWDQKLTEINRG